MGFPAVGTSTRTRHSNTRDCPCASLLTGVTSRHHPSNRTRTVRWSETTGGNNIRSNHFRLTDELTAVSHPTPTPTRSSKSFLKRCWGIFVIRLRPSFANTFSSFLPPFLHICRRYGYIGNTDDFGSRFGFWNHRTSHCNIRHVLLFLQSRLKSRLSTRID